MFRLLVLAAALLLPAAAVGAATDIPADKQAAIGELVEVTNFDRLMGQMVESVNASMRPVLKQQLAEAGRAKGTEIPEHVLDETIGMIEEFQRDLIEPVKQMSIAMYDKHFTLTEIRDLVAFYRTPSGQSVLRKLPQMMAEMMPALQTVLQTEMQTLMPRIRERMVGRLREKGYEL